ncbi:MAG: HAD family phosphatase [Oscillospiraceae bacterium]|nr:HAD family phosphatase [Oscillospiraceae bacterium]
MFKYKGIIALDLDGTLLNSDKQLSQTNYDTLAQAAAAGWAVVPTTGRFYGAMPQVVRDMPFVRYTITVNGAEIADLAENKVVYRAEIPYQQAIEIMEFMDGYPVIYDCYQAGEAFMTAAMKEHIDEMTQEYHYRKMLKELRQPVGELKQYLAEKKQDIQKTQFVTYDGAVQQELIGLIPQRFSDVILTVTAKNNAEINNVRANKGDALLALADYLGVPREKTVAFGDAMNDMAMIKAAGTGVAMANACDELKAVADFITLSNDENGVSHGIKEICFK